MDEMRHQPSPAFYFNECFAWGCDEPSIMTSVLWVGKGWDACLAMTGCWGMKKQTIRGLKWLNRIYRRFGNS